MKIKRVPELGKYFVWQTSEYASGEIDTEAPAEVLLHRIMPSTPQGYLVCECPTGMDAIKLVRALNDGEFVISPLRLPGINGHPERKPPPDASRPTADAIHRLQGILRDAAALAQRLGES